MYPVEQEKLTDIIRQVLEIEDITTGADDKDYLIRYRGSLIINSEKAYNQVSAHLQLFNITPLFRNEQNRHSILLVQGRIQPKPSNPWINLFLFLLTLASVIFAGAKYSYQGPISTEQSELFSTLLQIIRSGIPFAVSILAILLAHEFGHYLVARYHKTHVTLPYFIPLPFGLLGTMGAVILYKDPPKNKRILLDIGLAGPIAGLVVAIPILIYGLSISYIDVINLAPGQGIQLEGNSILYLLAKYVVFGRLLPAPTDYGNLPGLFYWIRYFFTSQPLPLGGIDVLIDPIAWAGWAGLLVTALNLLPAGQLDGGHVIYTLIGKKARRLLPFILIGLFLLGFVWSGWWLWAGLIFALGRVYAEPLDQITDLNPSRKVLAVIGLLIFLLVFTPVPLIQTFA